jgi:NAD(P)-dependent dehydrogenase (short-subunit alcohol dehydrogenase family)
MRIDMTGKTVLVTGGSRGIGAAAVRAFVQAGAKVGLHYRSDQGAAQQLADELGEQAVLLQADLGESADCERLWREAVARLGHIDVLVNNAGIALGTPNDPDAEAWLADWQRTLAVNLTAPGLLCRQAVAHFKARGGGRIVNISSRAAFRGDQPDYLAYAASKGGLVALTRSLARAYGKDGVVAFNVAPGFTRTEMAQDFIDQYGEDYAVNDIALTRLTEPKDIAPTLVFLASGLADHATGATIDINAASYVH